jgi:hypothetical protein
MDEKPKRRWLQFSLRTALLILLIAAIVFALVANYAHKRKSAIAAIRANGGTIKFGADSDPSWYEKLLRHFFGSETYQPVQSIDMLPEGRIKREKKNLPDDFLAQISSLSETQFLSLENTAISDSDWHNISKFRALYIIYLGHSNISDEGIKHLSQLPELDFLRLNHAKQITDAAIPSISKLPKLTNLKLDSTNITDQGVRTLSPISKLEVLELNHVKVTSRGVELLKNIPSLRTVLLHWTDVDDRALDHLGTLTNLKSLGVFQTRVTAEGIQRFRNLHPQCTVDGP